MLYPSPTRREPQHTDASSLLTSCHTRIRHFCEMAVTLSKAIDAPHDQIAEVARQLHRYFTQAFPLHAEDEDKSMLPRLRGRDADLDERLERMHAEHGRIEKLVVDQLPAWEVLAERPAELPELASQLLPAGRQLQTLMDQHLESEEKHIFVALDMLGRKDLEDIEREIRERRRQTYHW